MCTSRVLFWFVTDFIFTPFSSGTSCQSQKGDARNAPAGVGLHPREIAHWECQFEVARLAVRSKHSETCQRLLVEKNKSNFLERGRLLEMPRTFTATDLGTLTQRKFSHPRAYSGKGNGLQPFLRGDAERVGGEVARNCSRTFFRQAACWRRVSRGGPLISRHS